MQQKTDCRMSDRSGKKRRGASPASDDKEPREKVGKMDDSLGKPN